MSEILVAHGLAKSYWQGSVEVKVLEGVDLRILAGESVGVVGVSGSGKSTLLHILGGLDLPDTGSVLVKGTNLANLDQGELGSFRNLNIGFVYQFHHLLPEFTALENVAMPLMIGGSTRADAEEKAQDMLAQVSMSHRVTHFPSELSGGERQRVAIARAIVAHPSVVLADEPTGNLDEKSANEIHELVARLSKEMKVSFVVVTHNLDFAARLDRTLELHAGRLENQA